MNKKKKEAYKYIAEWLWKNRINTPENRRFARLRALSQANGVLKVKWDEHDMFCYCKPCLKLKGGTPDHFKGKPNE